MFFLIKKIVAKMKVCVAVIFFVIGSVYSRSVPIKPSDITVESLNGSPVVLVRKARQFGKRFVH